MNNHTTVKTISTKKQIFFDDRKIGVADVIVTLLGIDYYAESSGAFLYRGEIIPRLLCKVDEDEENHKRYKILSIV